MKFQIEELQSVKHDIHDTLEVEAHLTEGQMKDLVLTLWESLGDETLIEIFRQENFKLEPKL